VEGKGFFLFVGNGGGVDFTFDGESKGVLGVEGKVLRITLPVGAELPEPLKPAEPDEAVEPDEPAEPDEAVEPDEPDEPAEPAESVKTEEPTAPETMEILDVIDDDIF
jgi:hypothetical protein